MMKDQEAVKMSGERRAEARVEAEHQKNPLENLLEDNVPKEI